MSYKNLQVKSKRPRKKSHEEASRWEVYFPFGYQHDRHAIHVASFFCGITQAIGIIPEGVLGWFAISVFAFNILIIVQDFE
jgi:hypothetical protein